MNVQRLVVWAALLMSAPASCGSNSTGPTLPDADLRILFIGNSLTSTNNLPGLVQALAQANGRSMSQVAVTAPNFSLEEHWQTGIAAEIRRLRPDVVVMQQGPSSLPASRAHLIHWAGLVAGVAREVGAVPTLYMVWPDASRLFAFPDVAGSYAAAAEAVGGDLLPAGGTWLKAWDLDASLGLYGPDGFHPSYLGTLAAAWTIYAVLFNVEPSDLPVLADGVTGEQRVLLRQAVAASLAETWLQATARR